MGHKQPNGYPPPRDKSKPLPISPAPPPKRLPRVGDRIQINGVDVLGDLTMQYHDTTIVIRNGITSRGDAT